MKGINLYSAYLNYLLQDRMTAEQFHNLRHQFSHMLDNNEPEGAIQLIKDALSEFGV